MKVAFPQVLPGTYPVSISDNIQLLALNNKQPYEVNPKIPSVDAGGFLPCTIPTAFELTLSTTPPSVVDTDGSITDFVVGDPNQLLGKPVAWATVEVNGEVRQIPLY